MQQYTSPGGSDVGQESPTYSPDGTQLWVGRNDGYTKFTVNPDGSLSNPVQISIPAQGAKQALVGKAVFSPDGSTVYSAVNGQNTVVAINAATGAIEQTWNVGNAPRDLVLAGSKLYVSNEGGRPAKPGETTINSYGTQVPASDFTGATTTGTVSVIDTANPSAAPATHQRRPAPHRPVRQGRGAVRHGHEQRHRLGHRHLQRQGGADHLDAAVARIEGRVRA